MLKHLDAFLRQTTQNYNERKIMPQYVYPNRNSLGNVVVEYEYEQRGLQWWYRREVVIYSGEGNRIEQYSNWFGGYASREEVEHQIKRAKERDTLE